MTKDSWDIIFGFVQSIGALATAGSLIYIVRQVELQKKEIGINLDYQKREKALEIAKATHCTVSFEEDVKKGTTNADVIYTDIWVSMGEPDEVWAERIKLLKPYQVNKEVMANAKETAIFMHCLPSFHDQKTVIGRQIFEKFGIPEMEVTDEVIEGPQSVVFDEAENRMHTIKAVMYSTLW